MEFTANYKEMADFRIFESPEAMANSFIDRIRQAIMSASASGRNANIALSGGSTPIKIYDSLTEEQLDNTDWSKVNFFWGDERCVPPDDQDSNFGNAREHFLKKIEIPEENIFRIKGENEPEKETERYASVLQQLPVHGGLPVFDVIFLGIGEDGHTASIFPGYLELFKSDKWVANTKEPHTGQNRITFTGKILNNTYEALYIAAGKKKYTPIDKLLHKPSLAKKFPTSYVRPWHGDLRWYVDREAWPGE